MDIVNYLLSICLILFMALATYDGFILHIWRYKLYQHSESVFEHKTHTIRAILFPLIVWSLLIENTKTLFITGLVLVLIDSIVLAIDAYSEKESRRFMGGLPQSEYVMHLFANGFHFAIIALTLNLKLSIDGSGLTYIPLNLDSTAFSGTLLLFVAENALPGAILLAVIHFVLLFNKPKTIWDTYRNNIACC